MALLQAFHCFSRCEWVIEGGSGRWEVTPKLHTHNRSIHANIINNVIGHAKGEMDSRYVGSLPIEVTYSAIHMCDYKGLVLPQRS